MESVLIVIIFNYTIKLNVMNLNKWTCLENGLNKMANTETPFRTIEVAREAVIKLDRGIGEIFFIYEVGGLFYVSYQTTVPQFKAIAACSFKEFRFIS